MWPFDTFRKQKHDRIFNAAVLVMLGAYYDQRMTDVEKQRVKTEVARMLTGIAAEFRGVVATNWECEAAYRAAAMATVGIRLVDGLAWSELMEPWRGDEAWDSFFAVYDKRQYTPRFMIDFHPMHPATEDAKRSLRSLGIEIPEIGPWSLPRPDGLGTIGPGAGPKARPKPGR